MADWPRVTLKLATSLDGRIALGNGQSKWITGEKARACVHDVRARHDAILTGIGTVLADDPQMTARPQGGLSLRQPLRVVMDTHLKTPVDAKILEPGGATLFHGPGVEAASHLAKGAQCVEVGLDESGHASLGEALAFLRRAGIETVMIEAGGKLAGSALALGCVSQIDWFRAPVVLGGDGVPCVAALALESLKAAPQFTRIAVREVGADLWETYERH